MIIDAHTDISGYLVRQARAGREFALEEDILPQLLSGGITGIVNSVFLSGEELERPKPAALEQIQELKRQVDLSQQMEIVTSAAELEAAYKRDLVGVFISLEGAEPIETLSDLDEFYAAGVRLIGLTWNQANDYSGGCATPHFGLSDLGRELLERMAEQAMILDVSHLSDQALCDALDCYSGTLIASHSNARSYCDHPRNLKDEHLRAIANRGGVVGLNVRSQFVSESHPALEDLKRQLDYLIYVCGEDHVAFGFDFCDRLSSGVSENYDVLTGPEGVYEFLYQLEQPQRVKDKLAYQNWLRIYASLHS